MPAGDFPQMTSSVANWNYYDPVGTQDEAIAGGGNFTRTSELRERRLHTPQFEAALSAAQSKPRQPNPQEIMTRRIVKVFIADPNENVPLDKAILFEGAQKLTDATDQELFFETSLGTILVGYNEQRAKWLDKPASKASGKDIFLEPVKIRDLKMVVVTIAQF